MSSRLFILALSTAALGLSCKPTPRTAIEPPRGHKTEQHTPAAQDTPPAAPPQQTTPQQPQTAAPVGLVEVTITRQDFNRLRPWEKLSANTGRSMGIYLGNGRVLTLGRTARAATYAELSLPDHTRTAPARVVKYDAELDLALLTVEHAEDAAIFDTMPELSVGAPLSLGDHAEVCALVREQEPTSISVEAESADEEDNAPIPMLSLRAAKPLPQGISGGLPILREGKLVALVSEYSARDLSLSCINAEFITRFLNESSGAGESVPVLGLIFARLDDPTFNKYLKLNPQQGGVYVSKVLPGSSAQAAGVRAGDVLLSIDGLPLDKQGRCRHPLYGLLDARHIIRSLKPVGQQLTLTLSRDGVPMELPVQLNRDALTKSLIGQDKPGAPPRYIMWGGMLFQPLTETYMAALQKNAHSLPLPFLKVKDRVAELQAEGLREIVALTLVVPTPATLGYDSLGFCVVEQVNGKKVTSFAQFADLLDSPTEDGITELTLNRAPYHIYLDQQAVERSNDTLRRRVIRNLRQMGEQEH